MLRSILCTGADGVVVSSYRLSIPNGFDKRWLETTTPSALNKEWGRFSLWRSHPSFAKEGYSRVPTVFPIWTALPGEEGKTRPKGNAAKHPLKGADGVVVSSYRLSTANGFDNRWLETTTAPSRRRGLRFP